MPSSPYILSTVKIRCPKAHLVSKSDRGIGLTLTFAESWFSRVANESGAELYDFKTTVTLPPGPRFLQVDIRCGVTVVAAQLSLFIRVAGRDRELSFLSDNDPLGANEVIRSLVDLRTSPNNEVQIGFVAACLFNRPGSEVSLAIDSIDFLAWS